MFGVNDSNLVHQLKPYHSTDHALNAVDATGNLNSIVTSGTPPSAKNGPWRKTLKSKPVPKGSKPATLPPVQGHKHKKKDKTTKFEAFHYLPYSLWKTTFEVKLLKEDMIEN